MTDGQAQLPKTDTTEWEGSPLMTSEGQVRCFLLTGSSSNSNKPTTTMLISVPMVPSLKRLETCRRKIYSPAVVQVRDSEILAGVSAAPRTRKFNLAKSPSCINQWVTHWLALIHEPYIWQVTIDDHFQAGLGVFQSGRARTCPSDLTSGLTSWTQFRVDADSWWSAAKS